MTTPTRRTRRLVGVGAALGLAAVSMIGANPATADGHIPVVYSGQGLDDDGNIEEVICDDENTPYVLFVLTATRASEAEIDGGIFFAADDMYRQGRGNGSWKYYVEIGGDLTDLIGVVEASYDGPPTNAQLVISHGCPGDDQPPS